MVKEIIQLETDDVLRIQEALAVDGKTLAEQMGIDPSHLSRMKSRGELTVIASQKLLELATEMGINITDLLSLEGRKDTEKPRRRLGLDIIIPG